MWLAPLLVLLATPVAGSPSLPGAAPFPADFSAKLRQAVVDQGKDYRPRTEHLNPDGSPKYTNRLILEASPYLLQHAHNPVNWYPWGDEAFERARAEGKPVLLSVGYSTCHWCHVMERESFENEEIAAFLNQNYVAIKVDREQRPDVDAVYMSAVQFMTGGGGWPMTVWLTPERKPFYGGTYYPPHDGDRGMRLGFLTLLQKLRAAYDQKPDEVAAAAADIVGRLEKEAAASSPKTLDGKAAMQRAVDGYRDGFDRDNGGFGDAPKFPRPVLLEFLLRVARRNGDANAGEMVQQTLTAMHAGGMYDHVGGGFHRYSTDARWLVPHFEKMLYDNAQLTVAYLEAYQATGREEFATVAREILAYVEREMTASSGGFYSAADADSEGVEGKFFVWTPAEIEAVLGAERAKWFAALYGVTAEGNFDGRNILHLARPKAEVAAAFGIDPTAFDARIAAARAELYAARQKRIAPHVDRKILVSWNGLMISAFARAALVLGREEYAKAATRSADFIIASLEANGRLRRSSLDGRAQGNGYLDDYAFFIQGLLDLFDATGGVRWLAQAIALQRTLDAHFWDEAAGGYFLTPDDGDRLLVRRKPDDDGAEPAGNSVEMLNLLRLAEWTGDEAYRRRAARTIAAFASTIEQMPVAVPKMLSAVDFSLGPAKEIAIVLPRQGGDAAPLLDVVRRSFVPNRVFVVVREGAQLDEIAKVVPWLREKQAREGKATAYVCEGYVCALPTSRPDVLASQLRPPLAAPTPAGPVDLPPPPTHSAVDASP